MKKILTGKDIINTKDNTKRCQMSIEIAKGQAIYIDNVKELENQNYNHIPRID